MLVSIIIPTYNRAKLIKNAIESAINQTYKDIEVIVIDDGSSDETKDIVENYINLYGEKIKYYYKENGGVSSARNMGILLSKGEYISFLDSDDVIHQSKIEKQIECIKRTNTNVNYCNYKTKNNTNIKKHYIKYDTDDVMLNYIKNKTTPNTNCWLIKKNMIVDNNVFFRENCDWGEDMEFFVKTLVFSSVSYIDDELSVLNIHEEKDSLSAFSWDKIEKDIYIWNEIKQWLNNIILDIEVKKKVNEVIDGYRIPALVLCRLYLGKSDKENVKMYMEKYNDYIQKLTLCNGLRSIKLYIYRFILKYTI